MTAATYTSNLTDIFLFETTTGVVAYGGGGAGLSASPDFSMEGTNAVDKQISGVDRGLMAGPLTWAAGVYDHYYIWVMVGTPGLMDSRDNHGMHVSIGDDTSNFVKFSVEGNDTLPLGGGKVFSLRFNNVALANFRTLVGTPGTTPDHIGAGLNTTASVMGANLGVDAARFGSGYTILFGTGADPEANFAGIASDDEGTSEGVFQTANGGFNLQGKLRIGNGASECELLDANTNIFILDTLHALPDLSEILVAHESSILTLTNVAFIALAGKQQIVAGLNPNRGRFEMLTPIIDAQDETSYDNSPTTEGTFAGGTGYTVADVITMSDDSLVTVDAVSGGVITQFTVNSNDAAAEARSSLAGTANTQVSVAPTGGSGFTLTPDVDNLRTTPTVTAAGVGFIGTGESIMDSGADFDTCRWVGAGQIKANGASFPDSTVEGFDDQIIIDAQDETSYDNSPTTEGSFAGGSGHAASDILTMSDGSLVTVDAVSAGAVTQFTVDSSDAVASVTGVANTQLATDGSGTGFTLTPEIDNLVEIAALVWEGNLDPDGELDGMFFTKGTNPTHAIELGTDTPLTMTVRNWTTSGYDSGNDGKGATFWVRRTSGTVTINVIGGSGNFSYKSDGATVNVVIDPVTVAINVKDEAGANLQHISVYVQKKVPTKFTSGVGNNAGDGDIVVTQTIDSDIPDATWAIVLDRSLEGAGANPSLSYRVTSNDGANTLTFPTTVSGSATSTGSGTSLISTSTNFLTADIEEGDTIRNTTDGSFAVVDEIIDADNITTTALQGGTDDTWESGDGFSVHDLATTLISGTDLVDVPLFIGQTDASGNISFSYNRVSDLIIRVRVRSNNEAIEYIPQAFDGTITVDGFSRDVVLAEDTVTT